MRIFHEKVFSKLLVLACVMFVFVSGIFGLIVAHSSLCVGFGKKSVRACVRVSA